MNARIRKFRMMVTKLPHASLLHGRQGARGAFGRRAKHHEQVAEVEFAEHQAHDGHDDVIDQRAHDLAEGAADDHTHGQVDHVALDRKFLELLHHAHVVPPVWLVWRPFSHAAHRIRARAAADVPLRRADPENARVPSSTMPGCP